MNGRITEGEQRLAAAIKRYFIDRAACTKSDIVREGELLDELEAVMGSDYIEDFQREQIAVAPWT